MTFDSIAALKKHLGSRYYSDPSQLVLYVSEEKHADLVEYPVIARGLPSLRLVDSLRYVESPEHTIPVDVDQELEGETCRLEGE